MKRLFKNLTLVLLITLLLVSMGLSGCSKDNSTVVNDDQFSDDIKGKEDGKVTSKKTIIDYEEIGSKKALEMIDEVQKNIVVNEDSVTFIDGLGEEQTVKKNPTVVVGMYTSLVDAWMANGGHIEGITQWGGMDIPGVENAEIIGTASAPDLEKVVSMQPDLAIASTGGYHADLRKFLKENDIPYLVYQLKVMEDYIYISKVISEITGDEEAYKKNCVDVVKRVFQIAEYIKDNTEKQPRVLVLSSTPGNTNMRLETSPNGKKLDRLGAVNVITEGEDYQPLNMEKVLIEDPDIIIIQANPSKTDGFKSQKETDKAVMDAFAKDPAWNSLTAVKNNKIIMLPRSLFYYIPNDRFDEAYEFVAKRVYPELFE